MVIQPNVTEDNTSPDAKTPLDPLRRVFVPIEKRDVNGNWVFKTSDKSAYVRDEATGVIRRKHPKVNGKQARKARRREG